MSAQDVIDAMGHHFDEHLRCAACGVSWYAHQDVPARCERPKPPPRRTADERRREAQRERRKQLVEAAWRCPDHGAALEPSACGPCQWIAVQQALRRAG